MADWAAARELAPYVRRRDASLKGQAEVDWSNPRERRRFLTEVVAAARRLLEEAESALSVLPEHAQAAVREEAALLRSILAQDVVETPASGSPSGSGHPPGVELRDGTAPDRAPSATNPEQRHGRKSQSRTFTGHKGRVAVEPTSQLIVGIEVLPGNAGDAAGALAQVGDCAFGSGATRQEFADAGRALRAQVPGAPETWQLPKQRFTLLFTGEVVTEVRCPQDRSTTQVQRRKDGGGVFTFGDCCRRCPLRSVCVTRPGESRTIQIHPHEYLLQQAREYQQSPEGKRTFRGRVAAEHAFARLARLGVGQARYFGRQKTRAQWLLAATVVNLRRTWNWRGPDGLGRFWRLLTAPGRRQGGVRSWWSTSTRWTQVTGRAVAARAWLRPRSAAAFCHDF